MPKRDVTSWNSMILGFSTHGEVAAALEYFGCMVRTEKFDAQCHHVCRCLECGVITEAWLVRAADLLARAGLIDEALDVVSNMPMRPDLVIWRSLLDACCKQNAASRWNDVGMVRKLMTDKGVVKEPGCSSIEIDGVAHEFFAGDTSHPQTEEIYSALDVIEERVERVGYSPDSSQAPMG
ncbi:Pentatricopeptide repeat-containing protein, chloroplastic/mitochondrial [Vitis vinifera]|uniref:Pentatricopeptide repeat-containing protein, chloroplastic/mitochondrial n=1 Tax=Vitis vinifera TaxID=29760 RepID=A0A438HD79_VITVI|nr:Pentatricopeptide repeat-containing protein, chloroplastic/mitochondrial [Vitis vinifera]